MRNGDGLFQERQQGYAGAGQQNMGLASKPTPCLLRREDRRSAIHSGPIRVRLLDQSGYSSRIG